jgi:hypothetical protein
VADLAQRAVLHNFDQQFEKFAAIARGGLQVLQAPRREVVAGMAVRLTISMCRPSGYRPVFLVRQRA